MNRTIRFAAIGLALALAHGNLWPARGAAAGEEPRPAAVFELELIDTSGGAEQGEPARTAMLDRQLREALERSGRFRPVDLTAMRGRIEAAGRLSACERCVLDIARAAGAEVAVTGVVQKVSNLILHITVVMRQASDGKVAAAGSVDMRGNTDESWQRGLSYLLRNQLLAQ